MKQEKEICPKCGKRTLTVEDGDHIEVVSFCSKCGYYCCSA